MSHPIVTPALSPNLVADTICRIAELCLSIDNAVRPGRQVMDPFYVVHLTIDKVTACRQRVQNEMTGHRGRSEVQLYGIRRILLTRKSLVPPEERGEACCRTHQPAGSAGAGDMALLPGDSCCLQAGPSR